MTLCLHLLTGTSNCWNMAEIFQKGWWICSLCVHSFARPNFSWTAAVYKPLLKWHSLWFASSASCKWGLLWSYFTCRFGFLPVCLCYCSNQQFGLATGLPLTLFCLMLWSSLRAHNVASFGVKPNGKLRSQNASLSLGKLGMFSPWGTVRAGQQNHPQKGDGWGLGTHCFVLHWTSLEMFNF